MSKIVNLRKYDIILTYSWPDHGDQGICGHLFEVIEYYIILSKHFTVKMLFCGDINIELIRNSIYDKYNFPIYDILNNIIIIKRPKLLYCNMIIITDGNIRNSDNIIAVSIVYMACGDNRLQSYNNNNVYKLQDYRIYGECYNSINYKKKILFSGLKTNYENTDKYMLYITNHCRYINIDEIIKIKEYFGNDKKYILLSNDPQEYMNIKNVESVYLPVDNLFNKFGTYIYTPVARKFDCSPRFIAECKYIGKTVVYYNIDYLTNDLGLYWRKHDIDNDFDSICLNEDDEIIDIIHNIL